MLAIEAPTSFLVNCYSESRQHSLNLRFLEFVNIRAKHHWGNTEQGLHIYICNMVTVNQQFHYSSTVNSRKNGGEEHACLKSTVYIQIHFDRITNC